MLVTLWFGVVCVCVCVCVYMCVHVCVCVCVCVCMIGDRERSEVRFLGKKSIELFYNNSTVFHFLYFRLSFSS